jgi:hypothetical protein
MNDVFQTAGYTNIPLTLYLRIYTTILGVGRIQLDNITISPLLYNRIKQSNYYYYDSQISNDTHQITVFDANVTYSVGHI